MAFAHRSAGRAVSLILRDHGRFRAATRIDAIGRVARPRRAGLQTGWVRWLPGVATLRHYDIAWLRSDVLAGLALTAVLVPVGIAYADASSLPAISGLQATTFGLLAYALFGPSRMLVVRSAMSALARIRFYLTVRERFLPPTLSHGGLES